MLDVVCLVVFFFKQKTAYEMRISDWSSDVCSSDLVPKRAWVRWKRSALGQNDGGSQILPSASTAAAHRRQASPAAVGTALRLIKKAAEGLQPAATASPQGEKGSVAPQLPPPS